MATAVLVWAAATILLPTLAALLVDWASPQASRIAYIETSRKATARYYEDGDSVARAWAKRRPELADRPDLATSTEVKRLARDDYYKTLLAPHRADLDGRQREGALLADRLALLSPALLLQQALERAAGTDAVRHTRFQQESDRFNGSVRDFFRPIIINDVLQRPVPCAACPAQLTFDGWNHVPRFAALDEYSQPPTAAIRRCW